MAKKVIDEQGREFKSLYAAANAWGLYGIGGSNVEKLERKGQITIHGHTFKLSDEDYVAPAFAPHFAVGEISPVFEKLAARYSPKELEQLANGEGIERRRIDYPEIHLHGRHHHFVVISVTHIGDDEADIEIDGVTIRLFHGGDGSSYALSYRLQKLVEAITGGRKPNILLAGHVHKFCYIFERNIHAISVPCLQMQTAFMRGKKLAAHTGFLDLQFDVIDGGVCNLSVTLFPFYA